MKQLGEYIHLLTYDDDMSYTPFNNVFAEMIGMIYHWWANSMLHALHWRQALFLTLLFSLMFFYLTCFTFCFSFIPLHEPFAAYLCCIGRIALHTSEMIAEQPMGEQ